MKTKTLAIAAVAAALLAPLAARSGDAPSDSDARARAEAACDAHEWPEALAWFEVAAQSGDRTAQKIAALMHLYGDRLYPGLERNVERAKAWLRRAAAQGSIDAENMLVRLDRDPSLDPARLVSSVPGDSRPR